MYRDLKIEVWKALDTELKREFGISPDKERLNRRHYQLDVGKYTPYLVVEYSDLAGGNFGFLGALAHDCRPNGKEIYSSDLTCPGIGTVCVTSAYNLMQGLPDIRMDLSWQTPPKDLILGALQLENARNVLSGLGVNETERHHLLSFEILETLGIKVEPSHYASVVELIRPEIRAVVSGPMVKLMKVLLARAQTCNVSTG